MRHQLSQARQMPRLRRSYHRAQRREAGVTGQLGAHLLDDGGQPLVKRAVGRRQVFYVRRTGIARSYQDEDAGGVVFRRRHQRRQGIAAEQWVGGEGIGPQTGDSAPRRLDRTDHRFTVSLRRNRYIAALSVGDHQQTGFTGMSADLMQSRPAGRAETLEAGQLRLDRNAGRTGPLDQPLAVANDGLGCPSRRIQRVKQLIWLIDLSIGRRSTNAVAMNGNGVLRIQRPREAQRIRIEPETDLAAALFDERRQPICEGSDFQFSP